VVYDLPFSGHLCQGSHVSTLTLQDLKQQEFFLGCSKVSGKVDWKMLDEAVFQVFKVRWSSHSQRLLIFSRAFQPSRPWVPRNLWCFIEEGRLEGCTLPGLPTPPLLPLIVDLSSGFSIHSCAFSALLFSHQDYISKMDPASTLGLSTESIHGYSLSHVKRVLDAEPPEMPPCRRGVNNISVALKG
jgi:hypothetical protein